MKFNKKNTLSFDEMNKFIQEKILLEQIFKIKFKERSFDNKIFEPIFKMTVLFEEKEHVLSTEDGKDLFLSLNKLKDILYMVFAPHVKKSPQVEINPAIPTYQSMYDKIIYQIKENPFKHEASLGYLITDLNHKKLEQFSSKQINDLFIDFCYDNNLHCLKQLIDFSSSKELKLDFAFGIERACSAGNTSIIKYFCENQEQLKLSNHEMQLILDKGALWAMINKRDETLQYLSTQNDSVIEKNEKFLKIKSPKP